MSQRRVTPAGREPELGDTGQTLVLPPVLPCTFALIMSPWPLTSDRPYLCGPSHCDILVGHPQAPTKQHSDGISLEGREDSVSSQVSQVEGQDPTLVTSSDPNHLPKDPSPNTIIL